MTASSLGQVPAPPQRRPIALANATVHPVSSAPLKAASIIFDRGKIVVVGTNIDVPHGAEVVDLKGKHVYPGLIESYSYLGLTGIGDVTQTNDYEELGDINPNARAEVAVNPESEHIPVARANGVALAVTAPNGGLIPGRSALIMTDGWTWPEMTLKAPVSMMIEWPAMDVSTTDEKAARKQRDHIDKQIEALDKMIEDARAYMTATTSGQASTFAKTDVRWDAMLPVLKGDLPVWIRADSLLQIESAVSWAEEHDLKAVIVGGAGAYYCTDLLKRRNVPVVVTSVYHLPSRRDADVDELFALPLRLCEAGVRFCIGSGGSSNLRNLPYRAAKAAAYGLPKAEALKAVTLYPAQIIGVADRVGSLEPGKDATLMVTNGDPLEITTQVEQLYIQGRRIDLTSKQTRLYEKYQERYRRLRDEREGGR
jgi:imidazolonepropionase-like amidohydrolase